MTQRTLESYMKIQKILRNQKMIQCLSCCKRMEEVLEQRWCRLGRPELRLQENCKNWMQEENCMIQKRKMMTNWSWNWQGLKQCMTQRLQELGQKQQVHCNWIQKKRLQLACRGREDLPQILRLWWESTWEDWLGRG